MADDERLVKASYLFRMELLLGHDVSSTESKNNQPNRIILETLLVSVEEPTKCFSTVIVKESKIHGMGVFATSLIKKGDVITYYPPHYVLFFPRGSQGSNEISIVNCNLAVKAGISYQDLYSFSDYAFKLNSHYSIVGDPRLTSDSNFLGHMVNDGAKGHSTKENYDKKDHKIYDIVSLSKMNAYFEESYDDFLHVKVIAFRDIAEGEEIFAMYGYDYWTNREKTRLN